MNPEQWVILVSDVHRPTWYDVLTGLPAIVAATGWIVYVRFFVIRSSQGTRAGTRRIETVLVRCVLLFLSNRLLDIVGAVIGFAIFFAPGPATTPSDPFWIVVFVGGPLATAQLLAFVMLGWPIVRDARAVLRPAWTENRS
jgi:hypothetical protein